MTAFSSLCRVTLCRMTTKIRVYRSAARGDTRAAQLLWICFSSARVNKYFNVSLSTNDVPRAPPSHEEAPREQGHGEAPLPQGQGRHTRVDGRRGQSSGSSRGSPRSQTSRELGHHAVGYASKGHPVFDLSARYGMGIPRGAVDIIITSGGDGTTTAPVRRKRRRRTRTRRKKKRRKRERERGGGWSWCCNAHGENRKAAVNTTGGPRRPTSSSRSRRRCSREGWLGSITSPNSSSGCRRINI